MNKKYAEEAVVCRTKKKKSERHRYNITHPHGKKQNGSKHFTNAPASTQIKQKFVNPSHKTSPKALPLIDQNQMRQFG